MLKYERVPAEHMRGGVERYIEHGIPPGDFQMGVLTNDLKQAVGHADHINQRLLVEWVQWWIWEAPAACWGSPEAVSAWITSGGLQGHQGFDDSGDDDLKDGGIGVPGYGAARDADPMP